MVQRLPDTSLTHALMSGGRDHFGWGQDRYLAANFYDALNTNTRATGQWKKGSAPDFPEYPRPVSKAPASASKKRKSVADLFKQFTPGRK